MLLNQIRREHFAQLGRENASNREVITKKLVPRIQNENPNYLTLMSVLANIAQEEFLSKDLYFTDEHRKLVLYVGIVCFRALELAQLNGKLKEDASILSDVLMSDPDLTSTKQNIVETYEEMVLLMTKLGVNGGH